MRDASGVFLSAMEEPTMSESTADAPETPDAEVQEQEPELGDAGQKALKAERDARKAAEKSRAELEAKLKEIEDAQLSELDRAKKEAETSAAELAQLRTENIRANVALAKGVPADLVEFLTGANEEEITAKADTLLARLNAPTSPKPDPSQGPSGDKPKLSTADAFAEQLADF